MSPHRIELQQEAQRDTQVDDVLKSFGVSQYGFLPVKPPLKKLLSPYYDPWEVLMDDLPQRVKAGALRNSIRGLPQLCTGQLHKEAEWRRAYVILTFLTHGYIWGGSQPEEILPPQITVPLLQVCAHLELPPVATYASLNLWNFYMSNDKPYHIHCKSVSVPLDEPTLDDLTPNNSYAMHTLTGTLSESWFYTISLAMEHAGGRVIPTLLGALSAAQDPIPSYDLVIPALRALTSTIHTVTHLLDRMHEHCDPMTFYHHIRPLLAGSKNMAAAGLPRGIFYDEGNGNGQWRTLRGGSNGQSSLIQLFDVVLGVEHKAEGHATPDEKAKTRTFHEEVREYMPGPHRRFLEHVERMPNFRELVTLSADMEDHVVMKAAYDGAVKALTELRDRHLGIVARYIVVPSRQSCPEGVLQRGLAKSNDAVLERGSLAPHRRRSSISLRGTGGTMLMPFLKQSRDETLAAATCGR